tara:strand:- start:2197 stop:3312 length:1116 start_codon:yes stop_codon:yes gene_type:complete
MSKPKDQPSKDITTVINKKDIHAIVRKYNDQEAFDEYRRLWRESYKLEGVPDFPIQLDFELNYSCNFKCPMCTWSTESTKGMGKETWFSFDVFKEVIDQGVRKGLKVIRMNYINEPLIRPDLVKFIEYARQAGILDIYFSTNGSLLNEEISTALIKSGLTRLQVSLDASTEETYNIIRLSNYTLKEVTENINNFISIRDNMKSELPTLRVNFVKTEINEHELDSFVNYWKDKADAIGIQDLVNIMKPKKGEKISGVKSFKCPQPFNHLAIRYNGHVLPCCTFFGAELPIARLKSKKFPEARFSKKKNLALYQSPLAEAKDEAKLVLRTIEEIWKSKEIEFLRDIHRKGEYWKHPVCKKCVESTSHHDETQG